MHLYGQEVNPETYAISKADLILKGEGVEADNIRFGSTLSNDGFPASEFDFMLSNPPYGKSWKTDLERMGGKSGLYDMRFIVEHADDPDYSLATRSSDGQMMFLANMLSKMKQDTPLGSRIAEVHNGSSLFTGDAGQGESNIRRWIIENDWLEAIVALPLNMFYNTGIATYIWVLSNRKAAQRRGKVQLIDATQWFEPLRKNLGSKNCELSGEDVRRICDAFEAFEETEESKIFPNEAFGYWKVTVERPLRLEGIDPERAYKAREIKALKESVRAVGDGTAGDQAGASTSYRARPAAWAVRRDRQRQGRRSWSTSRIGSCGTPSRYPLMEEGGIEAFPAARGAAVRAGRLVRGVEREGWVRDQLYAAFLQADAAAVPGGDTGGHPGVGAGDGGGAGGIL